MNDVHIRNDKITREFRSIQISDDSARDPVGCGRFRLYNSAEIAVFVIFRFIECRNVNAFDFCKFDERIALVQPSPAAFRINIHKIVHKLLAVAEKHNVHDFRNGFGIAHAGAARCNKRHILSAFACEERYAAQFKHGQNVRVAHFIQQRKPDNIEFTQR